MRAKDVLVLDLHEIVAGKLVALIDLHSARDLFDTRQIPAIDGLGWDRIRAAVLARGASGRRDRRARLIDAIEDHPREFRQEAIDLPAARSSCRGERGGRVDRGDRRALRSQARIQECVAESYRGQLSGHGLIAMFNKSGYVLL